MWAAQATHHSFVVLILSQPLDMSTEGIGPLSAGLFILSFAYLWHKQPEQFAKVFLTCWEPGCSFGEKGEGDGT